MRPSLPIRIALAILTIPLALFLLIQVQQHLLRHRAERLHAEILALQLHPGTFAELQRLQREWGAWGHYEGQCTRAHCNYNIEMQGAFDHYVLPRFGAGGQYLLRSYLWLGGRDTVVRAELRVHNDRMWREDFTLDILTNPQEATMLFASLHGGSRLYSPWDGFFARDLRNGYRDGFEGFCTGCIGAEIAVTPQTNPADVAWLTKMNFDCITRWNPCKTEDDLIPAAWARHHSNSMRLPSELSIPFDQADLQSAPVAALGREASAVIRVQLLRQVQDSQSLEGHYYQARVLDQLKNASAFPPGSIQSFQIWKEAIVSAETLGNLTPGHEYLILYREPKGYPNAPLEVEAVVSATPQNRASIAAGIAEDVSANESYSYEPPPSQ